MKQILIGMVFVLLFLCSIDAFAEDTTEFRVVNDLQVNINDISGPGRSSSSLTDGTNYIETLNIYTKGTGDDFSYMFNIGGRTTNDKRQDSAEFALTSLKGHFTYQSHQLDAGDIFESYSQYSLDSALKGTSYKYYNEADELPNFAVVYGLAYARWENVWDGYGLSAVKRQVFGGDISHDINPVLTTGLSVIHSDDSESVYSSDSLFENTIYALYLKYTPIPGLTINAESAYSDTTEDDWVGSLIDSYAGNAQKLEIIGDGHPSRVVLKYERVSPKFKTLVGSAISDQERFNSSWRYHYSKTVTTQLGLLWMRNNINDSSQMIHIWQPSANISVRKLFDRKYANTSLSYKLERKKDNTLSTKNHFVALTHSDRYGSIDNSTSFGVNRFDTDNATRDQLDLTANTTFNTRIKKGAFIIKPMLSAGTFYYENQLDNGTNRVLQYSVGCGLDIPKKKIYSKVSVGQNRLHSYNQDNSYKWFSRFHIYYRPSFLGYLNHSTFSLRGAWNDYSFSTTSRDFVEKSVSIGINIPFRTK